MSAARMDTVELLAAPGLVARPTSEAVLWEKEPPSFDPIVVLWDDGSVGQDVLWAHLADLTIRADGWCSVPDFRSAMRSNQPVPWVRRVTRREWAPWEGEHTHGLAVVVFDSGLQWSCVNVTCHWLNTAAPNAIAYLPLPAESLSAEAIRRAAGVQE